MSARDLARWRAALHAAVDALLDSLAETEPVRTVQRPRRPETDEPVSDLAAARAERILSGRS